MSKRIWWYAAGGAAGFLLTLWILPGFLEWIAWLALVALVAAPVVGYFMLDPSQRRRLKRIRERRQLDR